MKLPKYLKKYFWDINFKKLDPDKYQDYIIARLLEHGNIRSLRWMLKNFKEGRIKKVVMEKKGFSPKTANFWALFFNINKSKVKCLNKSYQKIRSEYWIY